MTVFPFIQRLPWRISYQIFSALLGGYLFALALSIFIAKTLPIFRGEAVTWGLVLSFASYAAAIIWVFSQRSLIKGCGLLWLTTLFLSLTCWAITILGWSN